MGLLQLRSVSLGMLFRWQGKPAFDGNYFAAVAQCKPVFFRWQGKPAFDGNNCLQCHLMGIILLSMSWESFYFRCHGNYFTFDVI